MKEKIDSFHNQVQKNLKWNLTMHSLDGILFMIGMCFVDYTTILPAFVSTLTDSNILIGLIPSIMTVGWLLPQLLSAYFIESVKLKKSRVLQIGIGQRLPWFLMALFTVFSAKTHPEIALTAFFILFGLAMLSGGIQMPVWMDFVAGTISTNWRGRLFGIRGFAGGLLGIGAGIIVAQILEKYVFPINYSICFMMYFLFTSISLIFVVMVKEVEYPAVKERTSLTAYIKNIPGIVKKNRNYLFFLVSRILSSFIVIAAAFYTVYGIKKFDVTGRDIASFMILLVISKSLGMLVMGYIGDHKGHILALRLSLTMGIIGIFVACLATSVYHLFIVFILYGIYFSGHIVSGLNIILEFCLPEERPTYIGLTSTVVAPFAGFLPIAAGVLLEFKLITYQTAFLISGIVSSMGLMVLFLCVSEPRLKTGIQNNFITEIAKNIFNKK